MCYTSATAREGRGSLAGTPEMIVEKIPESTPWYASSLDGVLRP